MYEEQLWWPILCVLRRLQSHDAWMLGKTNQSLASNAQAAQTCSSPIRLRSHTISLRSAPHEARMVSFLGLHPICTRRGARQAAAFGASHSGSQPYQAHLEDLLVVVLKHMQVFLHVAHVVQSHLRWVGCQWQAPTFDQPWYRQTHRLVGRARGEHVLIERVEANAIDLGFMRFVGLHNARCRARFRRMKRYFNVICNA